MNKACPVVLRDTPNGKELLAFRHPLAGAQIVKGSIEKGESLEMACERELFEESGIRAKAGKFLGKWEANYEDQIWGFCQMEVNEDLADTWVHYTRDDGGHEFAFFWLNLDAELDDSFHPLFKGAIGYIRGKL